MKKRERLDKPPFVYDKHKITKGYGDTRFRFMPCGFAPDELNQMIYVKYKTHRQQFSDLDCKILSTDIDHIHYDLPDREILLTKSNYALGGTRPFNNPKTGDHWHKSVSLSPLTSVADDYYFDRFMINPSVFSAKTEPRIRDSKTCYTNDKIICSDSSAYQIFQGSAQFVDPDDLCKFYLNNVDEGVVIDIPTRSLFDKKEILEHTVKIQNLNTRYMKNLLKERPDFRLITVFHGLEIEYSDYFRNKIEEFDDDFQIAAIAGLMNLNPLEAAHKVLWTILRGKLYPQYHMLGVGHPILLAIIIWISYQLKKFNKNVLLTSDASTPILLSAQQTYYSQAAFHEGLNFTRFGIKMDTNKEAPGGHIANPHRRIATIDPISEIVGGYQDIISAYNTSATRAYVKYINILSTVRYCNLMCNYASKMDKKQYKELLLEQYKRSTHSQIISNAMEYIEMAFDSGLEKAFQKFKYYMPKLSGERTLHNFPPLYDIESEDKQNSIIKKKLMNKHIKQVIKNYYEFHKTGKKPKVYSNKELLGHIRKLKIVRK